MEIQTVKIENDGFRVNGNMCVPVSLDNADYVKVLEWIAEGNTPAPEFTDAEIAANTQAELNVTSRAYLASTDWYVTRHAETGVAIPSDVTTAREAARSAIV
jgi:hypothetical protein